MKDKDQSLIRLLSSPGLPPDLSGEVLYRAACIGAVTILREDGNCADLAEAVRRAASPEIRERALLSLAGLALRTGDASPEPIRQLYMLAVRDADPGAAEIIRRHALEDQDPGWNCAGHLLLGRKHLLLKQDPKLQNLSDFFLRADDPLRLRLLGLGEKMLPNWTLFMHFLSEPNEGNRSLLLEKYGSFPPEEKELLRYCIVPEQAIASLPADIVLRYEDPYASELCIRNGLRPSDPSMEALFFFLTGQWELYYAADSDYRRIRLAYEQNDPDLQRRLITAGRASGNNAWLRHVSSSAESLPHKGTLTDQRLLIQSMIEQKQWNALWEILPNVPLLCMPDVCEALKQAGFLPADPEGAAFLKKLNEVIAASRGLSPIPVRHT